MKVGVSVVVDGTTVVDVGVSVVGVGVTVENGVAVVVTGATVVVDGDSVVGVGVTTVKGVVDGVSVVGDGVTVVVLVVEGVGVMVHRLGVGPWTTDPVILRLLTVNEELAISPDAPQASAIGTQPTHCEDWMTIPSFANVLAMVAISLLDTFGVTSTPSRVTTNEPSNAKSMCIWYFDLPLY